MCCQSVISHGKMHRTQITIVNFNLCGFSEYLLNVRHFLILNWFTELRLCCESTFKAGFNAFRSNYC